VAVGGSCGEGASTAVVAGCSFNESSAVVTACVWLLDGVPAVLNLLPTVMLHLCSLG